MFSYNAKKDSITPLMYPKYVLTSGTKHDIYAFYDFGLMNQKFQINKKELKVYSEFTKREIFVFERDFRGTKTEKGYELKMVRKNNRHSDPRYLSANWLPKICDAAALKSLEPPKPPAPKVN